MTTKATNSVLNLVSPPIDDMVLLHGTLDNVVIGSHVPNTAVFTNLTVASLFTITNSTVGAVLVGNGINPVAGVAPGVAGTALISNGIGVDPSFQPITLNIGILSVPDGGTGHNFHPLGDVLVGNNADPIAEIPPAGAGTVLTSNGIGQLPSFQNVSGGVLGLTTNVVPKATSSTSLGDSSIVDNGTSVQINSGTFVNGTFNVGLAAGFANNLTVAGNIGTNDITITGTIFIGSSAGMAGDLTIAGNLGVNDVTTNGTLFVGDVATFDGPVTINNNVSANNATFNGTLFAGLSVSFANDLHVAGTTFSNVFVTTSDSRRKENISELKSQLKAIKTLKSVSFNYKGDTDEHYGFLAQDILDTDLAHLVVQTEVKTDETPDGLMGLNYQGIIASVVQAIQELEARVAHLETI